MTSVTVFFLLYLRKQKNPIFKVGFWNKLLIGYLLTIIISTILNFDSVISGGRYLNGTGYFDVLVNPLMFLLAFMPFFFGRNFFDNPQDTEYIFKSLTLLALIYTVPMLYEIRMSPQIHATLYGYFPGNFIQQVRDNGFRPIVFVGHGLALAFWFSTCTIAAIALYKAKVESFGLKKIFFLLAILVFCCKTVSAILYIIFAIVLLFFLNARKQILLSLVAATLVMVYPFNATSQFVKNDDVLDYIGTYSDDRRQSVETRFTNEERLVERALERPFFGWSGWGRNRVYNANGRDITITDGKWIVILGLNGVVGFALYYLLLIYPIILARKNYKYIENEQHQIYFVSLVIILAIGIFDSVPNTGMASIHLLIAGALVGQCEYIKNKQRQLIIEKNKLRD